MKTVIKSLALAGLVLLSIGSAAAAVTVNYVQPDRFSDLPFASWDREDVLKELTEHFGKLGARLPPGQDLRIEVTDVDLAGRLVPTFRGNDLRVLNGGADWPHIRLRYTLESNGSVIRSGDEHLSNMMYLDRINKYASGEMLRYEKQMIDEWFKQKILDGRGR